MDEWGPRADGGDTSTIDSMHVEDPGARAIEALLGQLPVREEWVWVSDREVRWWGSPVPVEISVSGPRDVMGVPHVRITASWQIAPTIGVGFEDACEALLPINQRSGGSMLWVDPHTHSLNATLTHCAHRGNSRILDSGVLSLLVLAGYVQPVLVGEFGKWFGAPVATPPHPRSGIRLDHENPLALLAVDGPDPRRWTPSSVGEMPDPLEPGRRSDHPLAPPAQPNGRPGSTAGATHHQDAAHVHPVLGGGLLSTLRLPESFDSREAAVFANGLNWAEANEPAGFSSWGAWTAIDSDRADRRHLVHVSFLPNAAARPGLAGFVTRTARKRASWATRRLSGDVPVVTV